MGKTTASLAFSAALARKGARVLFVELGESSSIAPLLSCPPLHYDFTTLEKNLWGIKVTGFEALQEYLLKQIKIERLFKLLFDNQPIRYFFEVAPALRDLMILGKIVHESESEKPDGMFDDIIIDAPATGHAMFLMRTPTVVRSLTHFGPIFDRANHIADVMQNPKRTKVHLVTLARSVVTGETLELIDQLKKNKMPLGRVFINRMLLQKGETTTSRDLKLLSQSASDPLIKAIAGRVYSEWREAARIQKYSKLPTDLLNESDQLNSLDVLAEWFEKRTSND